MTAFRDMTPDERAAARGAVHLLQGCNIRPEPIDWLWNGWLAAGKLHILAGAPGTGKTTLALALAAVLTIAGRWPDGSRVRQPGNVLVWSGEDDPADTLAPRLLACGADMQRVFFVGSVADEDGHRPFDPAKDIDGLAEAARRAGDIRLLITDPVVSAVVGDSHKNTEVRRALQPLVDLGHELDAAVLGISHFAKGSQGRDPTERVAGSLAFGALARVVLAAAKVQDEDKRILARAKSNIGPDDGGFEYELQQAAIEAFPGISATRVLWGAPLQGSARDILAAADTQPDGDDDRNAVDRWLRELLAESGPLPKRDVMAIGKQCGFPERTIQHARRRIGVEVSITGFGADKTAVWSLATNRASNHAQSCHPKNHGTNGTHGMNDTYGTNGEDDSIVPIVPFDSGCTQAGTNGGTDDSAPSWAASRDWQGF